MQLDGRAISKSALACIISATIFYIIGFLIDPSLIEYTPENPEAFNNQKNFAWASIAIGLLSAVLMYPRSKRS